MFFPVRPEGNPSTASPRDVLLYRGVCVFLILVSAMALVLTSPVTPISGVVIGLVVVATLLIPPPGSYPARLNRATLAAQLAVLLLSLFVGFWAFVFQGYTEDYGSEPVQSWPIGASLFLTAGALAFLMLRQRVPSLSLVGWVLVAATLGALLTSLALYAISGGQS